MWRRNYESTAPLCDLMAKRRFAVLVGFGVAYLYSDRIFGILTAPIESVGAAWDPA